MAAFLLLVIIIVGICVFVITSKNRRRREEVRLANEEYSDECRRKEKEELRKASAFDEKYGTCTKSIKWWFDESTNLIRVYGDSKIIVIKDDAMSFSDIIGVDYIDKAQDAVRFSTTKTDNGSMVGRAIVGGIVAGGLGAAVGAATANEQTIYNENIGHEYVVLINTKNLSKPLIELRISNNISQVNEVVATINAVISQNK